MKIFEPVSYNEEKNSITINLTELSNPTIKFKEDKTFLITSPALFKQGQHTRKMRKEIIRYYEILLENIYDYLNPKDFQTLKKLSQNQYLNEKNNDRRILNHLTDFGVEIIEETHEDLET